MSETKIICRLGGDEFVLLLMNLETNEEYQAILQRVIKFISQPVLLNESNEEKVSASIGFTIFPYDTDSPDILLRHADHAMYQAKILGRNRLHQYNPDSQTIN